MVTTNFLVKKRKISQLDSVPYTGEYNIDTFHFEFDEEWEGLDKTLVLISGGQRYNIALLNDSALMPFETYQIKGNVQIGLFGTDNGYRALATGWLPLYIEEDSYEVNTEPENLPSPTQWDLYVTEINGLLNQCRATKEDCEEILNQMQLDYEQYLQELNQIKSDTEDIKEDTQTIYRATYQIKTDVQGLKRQIEQKIDDANLRIDEYNQNAQQKTNAFNQNAEQKTTNFNQNAESKTNTFNQNATEKTNTFNTNANQKTNDYNDNATQKTNTFNENAQEKLDEVTQAGEEAVDNIETAEEQAVSHIQQEGSTYEEQIQLLASNYDDKEVTIEGSGTITDAINWYSDSTVKGKTSQDTTSISGGDEYDSPSPEHPQPIHNVSGDINIESSNNNILKFDDRVYSGTWRGLSLSISNNVANISGTTNQSYGAINLFDFKGANYASYLPLNSITMKLKPGNYSAILDKDITGEVAILKQNQSGTHTNLVKLNSNTNYRGTFTLNEEANIYVAFSFEGSGVAINQSFSIDLEESSSINQFEPHQGESITFPLSEGQNMYEGDYLADDGVHHVNNHVQLDGSESVTTDGTLADVKRYKISNIIADLKLGTTQLCSHLPYLFNYTRNSQHFYISNANLLFVFLPNTITDVREWISENKPEFVYQVNEDIIEPYTPVQQLAWDKIKKMRTYKNITHIYASSDDLAPDVDIKYLVNDKANDRLASIEARLDLLEG